MITKENVKNCLRSVVHPSKKEDIVSLRMVQAIKVEGNKVSFNLMFGKSDDPAIIPVKKDCVKTLQDTFEGIDVKGNIAVKIVDLNRNSSIFPEVENVIAIASGKGGVGKSTVAGNLAIALAKQGYRVGLLDADIFGPSIPKMFGVEDAQISIVQEEGKDCIVPFEKYGIKLLSIGFFVDPRKATVWRGPMAGNALKQMMQDGDWGSLDYLLIDLPPGTSDIHLSMVQGVSVAGAVIVSTPQEIALADAIKGIDMFESDSINVPVLGLVENMAWFTPEELPNNKYYIFGKEGCKKLAEEKGLPLLGQIPVVESIMRGGDEGKPIVLKEVHPMSLAFEEMAKNVVKAVDNRNKTLEPTKIVQVERK